MARRIEIGDALRASLDRHGITADPALPRVVARIIGRLDREVLPGRRDVLTDITVMPKPGPAWVRRIGGYSLWLAFRFDESSVTILGVMKHAPRPIRK